MKGKHKYLLYIYYEYLLATDATPVLATTFCTLLYYSPPFWSVLCTGFGPHAQSCSLSDVVNLLHLFLIPSTMPKITFCIVSGPSLLFIVWPKWASLSSLKWFSFSSSFQSFSSLLRMLVFFLFFQETHNTLSRASRIHISAAIILYSTDLKKVQASAP